MEIIVQGEGEVIVRFIDRRGRTLLQENLSVAGSPTVEARRILPLAVTTADGQVPIAPVLASQANPRQKVSFDGLEPSAFARRRCEEIGCPSSIIADAERGCVQPPPGEGLRAFISDDADLARLVRLAQSPKTPA